MRADIAQLKTDLSGARSDITRFAQGAERTLSSLRTAFATLGVSLGVGAFAAMIKSSIDAADHLNDLSKSTALTVEQLAGLSIAAKQSGTDLDGVAGSITKLAQNMGKDAEKFKAAGITARDPLDAFKQLADLFVAIEDPQTRAALGAATLGKNWATAAPLLAEGGKAIGEMVDKGTRLSGVTAELAKQSDAFNDKLVLLTGTNSIMNSVTGQLLPLMNKLAGDMLEAKERADGLNGSFSPLLEAFKAVVVVGGNVSFVLSAIGKDLGATAAQLVAFASGNWSEILTIRAERLADAAKERSAFDAWERSIMAVGTAAQVAASKLDAMDQVSRRMASAAAAEARAASADAEKRARGLIGGDGAGREKKVIDEIAAYNKKMRELDSKGWVQKIENDIREYEDEQAALRKIDEEYYAEKKRLQAIDSAGWIAYIEAMTSEYEAGLLAIHAATESNAESSDKAKKAITEYLDPAKAKSFGDALSSAFGSAGSALSKLINSLEDYGQKMAEIEKMRQTNAKINDPAIRAQNEIALAKQSALAQISAYGDMAAAAKGFFETGSSGYKALEAAEKVFRAFELASAIQTMLTKSGLLASFTSLFVASKTAETAATVASVAPDVAASMAKGTAAAAAGVANQAQGDPYTAWARMAAMAAVMVGLGFAVSGSFGGGAGGQTAASRQREQGTGTVLGDAEAKSQSLLNSLREIEKTDKLGLTYSHDMLEALRAIQSSMGALASLIFRTSGVTTGGNFGVQTGTLSRNTGDPLLGMLGINDSFLTRLDPILGGFIQTLQGLWGKTTQEITDAGVLINGSVRQLIAGQGMSQYANVTTDTSSWFGLVHDTSNSTMTTGLSDRLSRQFGLIFAQITDSIEAAAKALDMWSPKFADDLRNFVVEIDKISLQGLQGQDLQDALNSVFSTFADKVSLAFFGTGEMQDLAKAGEGFYETLIRVATGNEYVKQTFAALGLSMPLIGQEAITARMGLIDLVGGLESFGKLTQGYFENYYSEAEQRGNDARNLVAEFSRLGVAMPESTAAFRRLVEAQDLTTAAGREMWAALMALNEPFAEFANSVLGLDGKLHSLSDVTAQHASLQERLDLALGTRTAQQIERAREMAEAIDNVSLAMLQAIYVAEDTAAGQAAALERRRAEMSAEIELMKAQGKSAEALAAQRALDIEGMNLAEIASYDYIASLNAQIAAIRAAEDAERDRLAALKATSDLEGRLGVLRGDFTQRELDRAREWQAAASDTDRVLLTEIYRQEDLAEAAQRAADALGLQTDLWNQFATDAQKTERDVAAVRDGFAALGIAIPNSREAFANLVAGIDAATPAGQALLDALKLIAPAFANITSAAATMIGTLYGATPAGPQPPGTVWVDLGNGTGYWMAIPGGAADPGAGNADSIARQRRQLEIELQRALGNEEIALMMERADQLAALDASLRGLQQQVWDALDAAKLRAATEAWVGTLQDFLRGLTLDSTLSPLTARQRFSAAEAQYMQDYLLAGSGDAAARERYTAEAEAYLREALAMFGRGSTEYQAIFRDIQMQTQGLIDQGLTPTAATTVGDVNKTLLTGQESAKEQADALIETIRTLANKVDTLTRRVEDSTTTEAAGTEAIVDAIEGVGRKTATEIANRVPGGALS